MLKIKNCCKKCINCEFRNWTKIDSTLNTCCKKCAGCEYC